MFQSAAGNIVCCGNPNVNLLLAVLEEINFTSFFARKFGIEVDKNDLNFNKQYVKKKTHIEKMLIKKYKKY